MASVFLSYDRDDADKAKPIAVALERTGHTVWWDLHVRGGAQFGKVIEEALKAADAVVVLWSSHAIESAWVKDEAAAGRDSGRLVPVTIDGSEPPLGFRQFHTIDLSRRRKAQLEQLFEAITALAQRDAPPPPAVEPKRAVTSRNLRPWLAGGAVLAVVIAAVVLWRALDRSSGLPVVAVTAADASTGSRATASDLFVKLGTLAQIGQGQWQLVDAASLRSKPDFLFRAADSSSPTQPDANVVLLDGKDGTLLWSREFNAPDEAAADVRQQLSLTVGRVLGCALEARANGGLRRDLLKIFLDGCAQLSEASDLDPQKGAAIMRMVVNGQPRFVPAWRRLVLADVDVRTLAQNSGGDPGPERQLRQDIRDASRVAPELPEITLAEASLLPPTAYARSLDLLARAKAQAPDNPHVYTEEAQELARVGRMEESTASARRAAELDPLAPGATTQLIMALAHAGQIVAARRELDRAEKIWAGTGALRDAEFAFNFRYGDIRIAQRVDSRVGGDTYVRAREDPSPQNIDAMVKDLNQSKSHPTLDVAGGAIQALAQFHRTDDAFDWIAKVPTPAIAEASYILFRPYFTDVRRDPRFMLVAKRIGLVDYWRQSGHWPDYCNEPGLAYDCKAEAAKLGA
jgi:tetratricopeptide (TPR) repeat protein